jgi:O-antigen/teichoic acid export membrane protein
MRFCGDANDTLIGASLRNLAISGLHAFGLRCANLGLQIVTLILLGRLLGVGGYGHYAFAVALMTLIAIPVKMGFPNLLVRDTACYYSDDQWSKMKGLWRIAVVSAGGVGCLFCLAFWIILKMTASSIEPVRYDTLIWALPLIPLIALAQVRGAALRGLGRVIQGQLPEQVVRPFCLFGLVALFYILKDSTLMAKGAVQFHVIAAASACLVGTWLLMKARPRQFAQQRPEYELSMWFTTALSFGLTGAMQIINQNADVVILGMARDSTEVGAYKVATQAAMVVAFCLGAIGTVSAPRMASLHAKGIRTEVRRIYRFSIIFSIVGALPIVILFIGFGRPLLVWALGEGFKTAYIPLVILCIGQLMNVAVGPVGFLLNMTGHERTVARIVATSTGINIVFNLMLVWPLGGIGAALATVFSLSYWNLHLFFAARVKLPYLRE